MVCVELNEHLSFIYLFNLLIFTGFVNIWPYIILIGIFWDSINYKSSFTGLLPSLLGDIVYFSLMTWK